MKLHLNKFKLNRKTSVILLSIVSLLLVITAIVSHYWLDYKIVRKVEFRGIEYINIDELNDLTHQFIGMRKDSIDLFIAENQILKHPYIKNCFAEFNPTGNLIFNIEEVVPIAYCSYGDGTFSIIDATGETMPYEVYKNFEKLPLITGLTRTSKKILYKEAANIIEAIKENIYIYSQLSDLRYSEKLNGFSLITSGVSSNVIIGNSKNISEKIEKYRIISENKFFNNNFSDLKYIDLRWKNKIIVKKS